MSIGKQLLRNTAVGYIEMVVLVVSAMIIPPLLLTRLGKEGYGVWVLVGQVIAYLAILDLGVANSVGRFVAKYKACGNDLDTAVVVNSSIFLFLISSVAVAVVTLILWPNFSVFFELSPAYYVTGKWLIIITGFGLAFNLPIKIGQGLLEGTHSFHLLYFYRALGAVAKLILIVALFGIFRSDSLILLAVIFLVATTVPNLLMCFSGYGRLGKVPLGMRYVRFSHLKGIFSLSLSSLVVTVANLLLNQGQVIAIGKLVDAQSVALYAIPIMLLTYSSMMLAYIVGAFKPLASRMQALGQSERIQQLNIDGVKILFILSILVGVFAVTFGRSFLRLWLFSTNLSPEEFDMIYHVLIIMAIGFTLGSPQFITAKMMSGVDRHWFVSVVSLIAGAIGLLLGIVLIKIKLGISGMAVGWATVFFIKGLFVFPLRACRLFHIPFTDYFLKAYWPPLKAGSILAATAFGLWYFMGEMTVLTLILNVLICLTVYVFAVYFICLSESQRGFLWRLVRNVKAYFV